MSAAPRLTIAELAFEMKAIANQQAYALAALEEVVARTGSAPAAMALSILETRRSADSAGQVFRLLKALAPHEGAVRALLQDGAET